MLLGILAWFATQLLRSKGSKRISFGKANVEWNSLARRSPERGFRLFFSTPVRGLSEDRLSEFFALMDSLLTTIEHLPFECQVYYSSRGQRTREEFKRELKTSTEYFAEIDRSDAFVVIIPRDYRVGGYVSGVYFEAGYAMARGKPSIYFVPDVDGDSLPHRMRDAALIQGVDVTVMQYKSVEQVIACIRSKFAPPAGDS
jgi:nucleoside 2-deoxyribosyltransferase